MNGPMVAVSRIQQTRGSFLAGAEAEAEAEAEAAAAEIRTSMPSLVSRNWT